MTRRIAALIFALFIAVSLLTFWGIGAGAVGVGGFSLFRFVIKQKSFAELLGIFRK